MRIFDRYVVREVLLPFVLSLLLLTFLLIIPPILKDAYPLIAKGVDAIVVGKVLVLLLPQALAISIPMAVLLGLLIAFGRLSADREFVAMQSCGVSIYRLLRPLAVVAFVAMAGTAYVMIEARPDANQAFREIVFKEVASRVESKIQSRVLFDQFPGRVLYVREVDATHVMHDVFFADNSKEGTTTVSFAREGRFIIDRPRQLVQLQLSQGTQHTTLASQPDQYQGTDFEQLNLSLDAQAVFKQAPDRNPPEMSLSELRQTIARVKPTDHLSIEARMMFQNSFAIPVACCVLALVALGLGVSNRKDGKLASFAIGFIVVFAYYVILYGARGAAFGGILNPDIAPWLSPLIIGVFGVALAIWRSRSTDRPMLINWSINRSAPTDDADDGAPAPLPARPRMLAPSPSVTLPGVKLLDVYTSRQYLQVFVLSVLSALGVFYISTFIDLADKLFRGSATTVMMLRFFFYQTPQFLYYIIPIAVLVGTLVTIGVMTKNSELIVMKACGMSLYRAATPLVLFAIAAAAGLFGLQELVLARANHQAERLEGAIRGWPSQEPSGINRWIASNSGDIYHYDVFEPSRDQFVRFTKYHLDSHSWRLSDVTYADTVASPAVGADSDPGLRQWTARRGWRRTLSVNTSGGTHQTAVAYVPYDVRTLTLEAPEYFKTEVPDPVKMNFSQLRAHIAQLRASGSPAVSAIVQLQRKVAFPFATVIMALLAVPFAVTTGRRGAMYGIGIGIALSIAYWVIFQVFTAMGEGGVLTPTLAAWAPNLLFGAAALYMTLTVRT
jgi:LPS export ABC transporter permease LptG/LPS export ABC transporter permease LptF